MKIYSLTTFNNKLLVVESHAGTCLQGLGVLTLYAAAEKGTFNFNFNQYR